MHNLYVLGITTENRSVEEIARDAAVQIVELFDSLVEELQKEGNQIGGTGNE